MLQIQHIKKEYRTGTLVQKALDDVSLNLRDNEFVAILGPSGSGKTTLLNILSQFIPEKERIITVEDSAELKLSHENLCRLEARPANVEGQGRVTIRDLVINTLRMRPDRIIVGECRGAEALDMLQAMNLYVQPREQSARRAVASRKHGHDGGIRTAFVGNPGTDRVGDSPDRPADPASGRLQKNRQDLRSDRTGRQHHSPAGHLHVRTGRV